MVHQDRLRWPVGPGFDTMEDTDPRMIVMPSTSRDWPSPLAHAVANFPPPAVAVLLGSMATASHAQCAIPAALGRWRRAREAGVALQIEQACQVIVLLAKKGVDFDRKFTGSNSPRRILELAGFPMGLLAPKPHRVPVRVRSCP